MAAVRIPQDRLSVLSERLTETIAGRRVRAAVFTTFTFDPGFFELHVLPCLFDRPFSQVEKIKRVQLDDALRSVDVAVYYDRTALSQDATPAQLDFRRLDVRRSTGVFHPKVVLVLVEDPSPEENQNTDRTTTSLIVGTLSANLTRAGWWENVETGHFEEIQDRTDDPSRCPFRKDLLALMRQVRRAAVENEEHRALDLVHDFVTERMNREEMYHHSSRGGYYTRLFVGQTDLPSWLEELNLSRHDWNLEIVSPFFDGGDPGALKNLIDMLDPRETRVFLPRDVDGKALVTESSYNQIAGLAAWSDAPDSLTRPGARKATEKAAPRYVHAKVYRLWQRGGPELVLTGSVNLTQPAHSHGKAGNLEAAFLVDIADHSHGQRWWLDPLEKAPMEFAEEQPTEDAECRPVPVDISLRYDWSTRTFAYRIDDDSTEAFAIAEPGGRLLGSILNPRPGEWVACDAGLADQVRQLLESTSFLEVQHEKGCWRILVREEGMNHRPSLLLTLTPEEILMYWSLLSPAQQEQFILEKLVADAQLEGITVDRGNRYAVQDTIFDRFAGIYHAFGRLRGHVVDSIEDDHLREADARLFGAKYDSLPVLLEKVQGRRDQDPVVRYVTFLCAQQLRDEISSEYPDFWRRRLRDASRLDELLKEILVVRAQLDLSQDPEADEFLAWFESMFLRRVHQPKAIR